MLKEMSSSFKIICYNVDAEIPQILTLRLKEPFHCIFPRRESEFPTFQHVWKAAQLLRSGDVIKGKVFSRDDWPAVRSCLSWLLYLHRSSHEHSLLSSGSVERHLWPVDDLDIRSRHVS